MFWNKRLVFKIGGGFGGVVLLLVIIAVVSLNGVREISKAHVSYSLNNEEVGMQAEYGLNLQKAQGHIKEFIINQDPNAVTEYKKLYDIMYGVLETAEKHLVGNRERTEVVHTFMKNLRDYDAAFAQIQQHITESNALLENSLSTKGGQMEADLTQIMRSANEEGNMEVAYMAGQALRHLLLGRLYVLKYFTDNSQENIDRVETEFGEVATRYTIIKDSLVQPDQIKLSKRVFETAQGYLADFKTAVENIKASNNLIETTLNPVGKTMERDLVEVYNMVVKESDSLGQKVHSQSSSVARTIVIVAVLAIILAVIAGFLISRSITVPVAKAVEFAENMAQGDLCQVLEIKQEDEIGTLARALNNMASSLRDMFRNITRGVETLSSSSTELSAISEQMTQGITTASDKSNTVSAAAEEMTTNMTNVAAAMEQSATNTNMVATAADQMSATIGEIAKNAEKARGISGEAAHKAANASTNMDQLSEAAGAIGKVIETITDISEQVNLLALNATIEAARAGEAGKGFAVVANEIKELAKQTAEATGDIKEKIEGIQGTTNMTVGQISEITQVITDVNDVVATIATAVEEQSAATRDIATNVAQASRGIQEVNENVNQSSSVSSEISQDIAGVSVSMNEMSTSSNQVNLSAQELSQLSESLKQMVDQFKI